MSCEQRLLGGGTFLSSTHAHSCTLPHAHPTLSTPPTQVEVSLQPWRAFKPDGVILFSDILTPLAGMNIPFDIVTVS
jgi:uroporphyrinogen-III decarboxylase